MPDPPPPPGPVEVEAAVLGHPAVARLDGGPFGTVASYLPGRRVLGVRIGDPDRDPAEPVEIAVVVRLGTPLPQLARELAEVVRGVLGPVRVDVMFCDVDPDPPAAPEPAPTGPGDEGRLA
jgi:hypothetical protein